ncbi:MAG: hypothetical protein D6690_15240 [Nitrospirae bacterium]|nr:MAG: hypothetical protein D6690_15240 [Nitrospirota bacterium]
MHALAFTTGQIVYVFFADRRYRNESVAHTRGHSFPFCLTSSFPVHSEVTRPRRQARHPRPDPIAITELDHLFDHQRPPIQPVQSRHHVTQRYFVSATEPNHLSISSARWIERAVTEQDRVAKKPGDRSR